MGDGMDPRHPRHDGSHGPDCFGCRIKSVQVSPAATPSRRNNVEPSKGNNSWEKGILRDERGIPIRRGGKVIGLKEAAGQRHKIEAELRALRQGHDPAQVTS